MLKNELSFICPVNLMYIEEGNEKHDGLIHLHASATLNMEAQNSLSELQIDEVSEFIIVGSEIRVALNRDAEGRQLSYHEVSELSDRLVGVTKSWALDNEAKKWEFTYFADTKQMMAGHSQTRTFHGADQSG